MNIDILDKVLKILYESDSAYILSYKNPNDKLWDIGYKDRVIILKKLAFEGYALENKTEIFTQSVITYVISFDGKLFYEFSAIKDRPFHARNIKNKWNNAYKISKTILIIINAIAIIFISWLTLKSQEKSNQIEQKQIVIDSLSNLTKSQRIEIDGLKKFILDTSKVQ
jgi:hypothetical protein